MSSLQAASEDMEAGLIATSVGGIPRLLTIGVHPFNGPPLRLTMAREGIVMGLSDQPFEVMCPDCGAMLKVDPVTRAIISHKRSGVG